MYLLTTSYAWGVSSCKHTFLQGNQVICDAQKSFARTYWMEVSSFFLLLNIYHRNIQFIEFLRIYICDLSLGEAETVQDIRVYYVFRKRRRVANLILCLGILTIHWSSRIQWPDTVVELQILITRAICLEFFKLVS